MKALCESDKGAAYRVLSDKKFILADKRESEDALEKLWTELQNQV